MFSLQGSPGNTHNHLVFSMARADLRPKERLYTDDLVSLKRLCGRSGKAVCKLLAAVNMTNLPQ